MGALVFVCPTSGREVSTGVEIDAESYGDLPKVLAENSCPACGRTHNLYQVEARLVDGEQNSPRNWSKRRSRDTQHGPAIYLFHNQLGNERELSRIIELTGASRYEAAHGEDATLVDRLDVGDVTA